jgi:uncharacterized protein
VERTVVLDTNALFLPVRVGFPMEREVRRLVPGARIVVPESVRRELDRLAARATPGARAARELADRFSSCPTAAEGDDGILEVATREGALVVTADRELQLRLRQRGIAVLVPRDHHKLEPRAGLPNG